MAEIHAVATITSKGQITLPKPIRKALGVDSGGKVAFRFDGRSITVSRADPTEHTDPAIARFLALLERDLSNGKNVAVLPPALAKSLKRALKRATSVSEDIEGEVSL